MNSLNLLQDLVLDLYNGGKISKREMVNILQWSNRISGDDKCEKIKTSKKQSNAT